MEQRDYLATVKAPKGKRNPRSVVHCGGRSGYIAPPRWPDDSAPAQTLYVTVCYARGEAVRYKKRVLAGYLRYGGCHNGGSCVGPAVFEMLLPEAYIYTGIGK